MPISTNVRDIEQRLAALRQAASSTLAPSTKLASIDEFLSGSTLSVDAGKRYHDVIESQRSLGHGKNSRAVGARALQAGISPKDTTGLMAELEGLTQPQQRAAMTAVVTCLDRMEEAYHLVGRAAAQRDSRLLLLPYQLNGVLFESLRSRLARHLVGETGAIQKERNELLRNMFHVYGDRYIGSHTCVNSALATSEILEEQGVDHSLYLEKDSARPGDGHCFVGALIDPSGSREVTSNNVLIVDPSWKQFLPAWESADYRGLPNIFVGTYSQLATTLGRVHTDAGELASQLTFFSRGGVTSKNTAIDYFSS